jgi:hypothetical protein
MATKGMAWVRSLVGAVWLNGALEKLLNPHFPKQFAQSLKAGGFISQAPPLAECARRSGEFEVRKPLI